VTISIVGSFLILLVGVLYFAQSVLLPVVLAFLFSLILSPIVRTFKRFGFPESITAVILIVIVASAAGGGVYSLSGPVSTWVEEAPSIGLKLRSKLSALRGPVEKIKEAQKQVDAATKQVTEPSSLEVVVKEPGLISKAAQGAPDVLAGAALTVVLLMFVLASGDMFHEKLVRVLPTLTDKKQALRIAKDIEQDVSQYLLTITAINAVLGAVVASGLYLIGMPNPVLWGVAAALLNFIPYIGAIIGITVVGLVAVVSYPSLGQAFLAPAIYLVCTVIEGQFVTPALVGRRMQINTIAVLLAVAFWGWLWGIAGIFIAVPILIIIKVFSTQIAGLEGLQEFLSPRDFESNQSE
jgi:predicted PurR-regulated permease PerM